MKMEATTDVSFELRTIWSDRYSNRSNQHIDPNLSDRNLFARLHPNVARTLYRDALQKAKQLTNHRNVSGWSIHSDGSQSQLCKSGIEFLPIVITLFDSQDATESKTIYVSYNGGDLETPLSEFGKSLYGLIYCCMLK
jgi:hypothetical protein